MKMIAKTLMGLEEVLARELRELGMKGVSVGRRMVEFEGGREEMYRALLSADCHACVVPHT